VRGFALLQLGGYIRRPETAHRAPSFITVNPGEEDAQPQGVDIYGFIAIGAMTLMLVLVVAKVVPPRMYSPLFYAAAGFFAIRIVLRIALTRQRKKEAELSGEGKGGRRDLTLFRGREYGTDITFAEDFCAVDLCSHGIVKPVTRTEPSIRARPLRSSSSLQR